MKPGLIELITGELGAALFGGLISKIEQPDERNLILRVFVRGGEERLIISAHHTLARIHLTRHKFVNPKTPKRFCAYLRSRITGARITGVTQAPGERIVRFSLEKKVESGGAGGAGTSTHTLVAELTGKSSNIILIDAGGVVEDALRYFPEDSARPVVPGAVLEDLPPLPKTAPKETGPLIEQRDGQTWNEAVDEYYSALIEKEALGKRLRVLAKALRTARKKTERKLRNLNKDRERALKEREYLGFGELLKTNLGKLKRGMREARVTDYTRTPLGEVTVPLDEKLGPLENAEKYFKRGKKAGVALGLLKKRIPRVEGEIEYLSTLAFELESIENAGDADALADSLAQAGYMKASKGARETHARVEPVRRVTSSEGFEMLCGKSGAGNDLIIKKYARADDIWFHASGVPGSHVLIKAAGKGALLSEKTIEEAAAWAAWHSKARGELKAEVTYTGAGNVRKPRGAPPGTVVLAEQKTMVVEPRDLEKLKQS